MKIDWILIALTCRRFIPAGLLLISAWVHATPITTINLGDVPYYVGKAATSMHDGPFIDEWKFSIPRTSLEFGIQLAPYSAIEVDLFKGTSLLRKETYLGLFTYFDEDPLHLTYASDYVSSIAGDYSLWVYSYPALTGFHAYSVFAYANRNTYIPDASVPEPSTWLLILPAFAAIMVLRRARK